MRIELGRVRDLLDDGGSADDEHRVLVDRLWPRGIAKERLAHDAWDKDIAPSPELRKAFHAGELDFEQFREHYLGELSDSDAPRRLLEAAADAEARDRKSTRLNSSHVAISYAVFCSKNTKAKLTT